MTQAQGHFVSISDLPVECIVYETEKGLYLIDIFRYGVYLARPVRDDEACKDFRYRDYVVVEGKRYLLLEHIPPD
ncbi:hypothetical protein [Mitsuokella multacida]|uniref:hypothetical protein n=1 Tax=Mitsuokella multacida TaxID=52226 RepID=UPI0026728243|nr:hypothetical protein [Mitsuokella multacida]